MEYADCYLILQEGIIPAWEDEENKNGGKWSIQLPKDKNRANVDKMWLYTVRSRSFCFIHPGGIDK